MRAREAPLTARWWNLAKRGSPRSTAELEEHDAILYSLRETD
jgi:hypothetical protein